MSQKPETTYSCRECGKQVERKGDELVRHCDCNGGVTAHLHATAVGKSSVADKART